MALIDNTSPFLEVLDYANQTTAAKANIDALIEYASECINLECNRTFEYDATITETIDGDGSESIFLKNTPIVSLTSITITNGDEVTVVDDVDFLYDENTGEVRWISTSTNQYAGYFPQGFRNIEVNYSGGYTVIPRTIQLICAEAVIEYFNREDAAFQIRSEKIGPNSYRSFIDQVIFNKRKILHKYKRRIVV